MLTVLHEAKPRDQNWQNDTHLKLREMLCWEMLGEIVSCVVKTKLPEELHTKCGLSGAASIHNLAFLAHHNYSRHSESSGEHCLAYLARTNKTHEEYKHFMTNPASFFATSHPSSAPVTGNGGTGWYFPAHVLLKLLHTRAMRKKRRADCLFFITNCQVKL